MNIVSLYFFWIAFIFLVDAMDELMHFPMNNWALLSFASGIFALFTIPFWIIHRVKSLGIFPEAPAAQFKIDTPHLHPIHTHHVWRKEALFIFQQQPGTFAYPWWLTRKKRKERFTCPGAVMIFCCAL